MSVQESVSNKNLATAFSNILGLMLCSTECSWTKAHYFYSMQKPF